MRILIIIFLVLGTYAGSDFLLNKKIPKWKTQLFEIMEEAKEISPEKIAELARLSNEKFPNVFPFSCIQSIFSEASLIFQEIEKMKKINFVFSEKNVEISCLFSFFENLKNIEKSLINIEKNISRIPNFLLDENQKIKKNQVLERVYFAQEIVEDCLKFEKIVRGFSEKNERVLILLQNQNEPRSTGGFVGSFVLLDFEKDRLFWKFSDIYGFDRRVLLKDQFEAPLFFHNLSQKISLRDANFWPDFSVSAQKYQHFFESIGEKSPQIVLAINLNSIAEVLKITGPVMIDRWQFELNESNFDLILQFLVESKITGRFEVKKPVQIFAEGLFSKIKEANINFNSLSSFDWKLFLKQKNLLAFSDNKTLQKLFEKWRIDGKLRAKKGVDNFLYFDFLSVGANKSEKFMWSKFWHDSLIMKDGIVRNTLSLRRTHSLRSGEIESLLGWQLLPQNVKDLMNEELLWKLGMGENRMVLRVYVPLDAKLVSYENLGGKITQAISENKEFKIFEIPMNVLPGESLETNLSYETKINRGSQNWRPYFLQVGGTSGINQSSFMETISTEQAGKFSAETLNIGKPVPLVDLDFRALVEF